MNLQPLIIAVDLGTSGIKVALFDIAGQVLGWESQAIKLILTDDGGTEQSPADWWQAFLAATGLLLERRPDARGRVVAICCSTQGEGTIPVNRGGEPLSNAMLWMDMRGASYLRQQLKGWVNMEGVGLLNLLRFIRLTGGAPSMSGKDPAGHTLWIRDQRPDIYRQTYKFLNVLDYMNLRLSGKFLATFDSIVTNWATDNRNPNDIRYDPRLVRCLGIDGEKLPDIVPCTTVIGDLLSDVADALGLSRQVKVVAGAIDTTAAAIGSGAIGDYEPHLYFGTSSWVCAHVPFKKTNLKSKLASLPCAVPDRYLLTAMQATAGGNLTFLRDNILYHKDELLQEADQPDIFKLLDQIAGRVPAGANGLLYTPWLWGERAPFEDRYLRGGLFNLSLENNRADILRAVLEGVAMNTRWLISPIERFLGSTVQSLNFVGGGAQSDLWCQILADVMNLQIKQVANPICANARGAAWIAAVGMGLLRFQEIPDLVQIRQTYIPQPTYRALYDQRFAVFKQLYSQLKGIYLQLNRHL